MVENFLGIHSPQLYKCSLYKYFISHSTMDVYAEHKETGENFHLIFYFVEYFSGPLRWEGINFILGPSQEVRELIGKKPPFNDMPLDAISKFHLYTLNGSDVVIKIIATRAEIEKSQ